MGSGSFPLTSHKEFYEDNPRYESPYVGVPRDVAAVAGTHELEGEPENEEDERQQSKQTKRCPGPGEWGGC